MPRDGRERLACFARPDVRWNDWPIAIRRETARRKAERLACDARPDVRWNDSLIRSGNRIRIDHPPFGC